MTPSRNLREEVAKAVADTVNRLEPNASFRKVLNESRRLGVVKWDRTLRKYLDLMLLGGVLERHRKDVGSVYPMELYKVKSTQPCIRVGLSVLTFHGLNWEIEKPDVIKVRSDFEAMVHARPIRLNSRMILAGCLEDCIAYELKLDAQAKRGTLELLVGLIGSKRVELPYLFERADRIGVGRTMRALFGRIVAVFSSSKPAAEDGRGFLIARETFLKLVRQYSSLGLGEILSQRGKGSAGLNLVHGLLDTTIVTVTAKQLGAMG